MEVQDFLFATAWHVLAADYVDASDKDALRRLGRGFGWDDATIGRRISNPWEPWGGRDL